MNSENGDVSLFECHNARQKGDSVYCSAGHLLPRRVTVERVNIGEEIYCRCCQGCEELSYEHWES